MRELIHLIIEKLREEGYGGYYDGDDISIESPSGEEFVIHVEEA